MRLAALVLGRIVLAGSVGCAGNGELGADPAGNVEASTAGLPPSAHALVLQRDQLDQQQGRSVLDAMRADLPAVHITEAATGCPSLAMRGPNVFPGVSEPTVYLDGAAATNTCLLEDLPAQQIARVEVYPLGVTPRPGYETNSSGLILLFSRWASDEPGAASIRR